MLWGSPTFYYDSFDQYTLMVLLIHLLPLGGAAFSDPQHMRETAGQSCPLPSLWVHTCGGTDGRNQVQGNTVSGVDCPQLPWGSSVPISSTLNKRRSCPKQGSTEQELSPSCNSVNPRTTSEFSTKLHTSWGTEPQKGNRGLGAGFRPMNQQLWLTF